MELEELYDYKNRLMHDLCSNEKIVKLITGNKKARVPNHTLAYTQIFPYEYVPETTSAAQTYICFDVDIVSVPDKTYYIPVLYIWVFTHKSKMRTEDGTLVLDKISSEIDKVLNGNMFYGLGHLELDSVRRFTPILDYLGRVLTYFAKDFNRAPGPRPIPSNRKKGL